MNISTEKLKNNWEYCTLAAVVIIAAAILAMHFMSNTESQSSAIIHGSSLETESVLSEQAFDFLHKKTATPEMNPFTLPIEAPQSKPKPAPGPVALPPKPAPKPQPQKEEIKQEPAKPKPKYKVGEVQFVLRGKTSSAKAMAVIKITTDGASKNIRLGIGENRSGIKILEIHSNEIIVQDARGTKFTMLRGEKKKMAFLSDAE